MFKHECVLGETRSGPVSYLIAKYSFYPHFKTFQTHVLVSTPVERSRSGEIGQVSGLTPDIPVTGDSGCLENLFHDRMGKERSTGEHHGLNYLTDEIGSTKWFAITNFACLGGWEKTRS